ncbi:hypothetical protein PGT21_017763 [Puccinia graminis f. sp. tritici]|uniref:Replication factor A protein 3 n=1 Tax=Puccinia graminis f. sp. tritici TaxID=56615 RepID=A0A5B0MP64_PUCGR|nr:hypothetical protein PGT21_017763 [Puccinia graminis f. sp. tritici]
MDVPTPRVSSSLLGQYVGQVVRISGKVISLSPELLIESSDGGQVTVGDSAACGTEITDEFIELVAKVETETRVKTLDCSNLGDKYGRRRFLQISKIDKLAELCPKCFGPTVPGKKEDEPDYIVCMDGNFQHRRHKAASNEIIPLKNPSLFIKPDEVEAMAISMSNNRIADVEPESSSVRTFLS